MLRRVVASWLIICADLTFVLCCVVLCCVVLCCDDDGVVVDDQAVSCEDLLGWSIEFESLTDRVSSLFVHPRSQAHSGQYLEGLLAPVDRKNGWTIAEHAGEKEPKAMQRFLNLTSWDADAVRDMNRDYAIENLGDPTVF